MEDKFLKKIQNDIKSTKNPLVLNNSDNLSKNKKDDNKKSRFIATCKRGERGGRGGIPARLKCSVQKVVAIQSSDSLFFLFFSDTTFCA